MSCPYCGGHCHYKERAGEAIFHCQDCLGHFTLDGEWLPPHNDQRAIGKNGRSKEGKYDFGKEKDNA